MGDKASLTCEVQKWAEKYFEVSPPTIRNWLRFFEERKLIEITGGGQGRGRKWVIQFTDWIKKKIELARKGIKSITKDRLNKLEAEYLKSVSWTEKNTKNPNNVYRHSKFKNSLRDNPQGNSPKTKKASTKGWKEYQKKLSDVSDEIILEGQGATEFDRFMAMIRKWLWQEQGLSVELDDIISNAIGSLVKGASFSFAIRIWNKLRDSIAKILSLIEKTVSRSKIYAIVKKFVGIEYSQEHKGRLPGYVDGEAYDLTTHQGRKKYNREVKALLREATGNPVTCPRCGKELTGQSYRYPLRFYNPHKCICAYVSVSKLNEERERKKRLFFKR